MGGWAPIGIAVSFLLLLSPILYVQFAKWVLAPIVVRRGNGIPLRPTWEETRLDDLSQEVREFLGTTIGQFRGAGFDVAANVTQDAPMAAVERSIRVLLVNRATGDVASLIAIVLRVERKNVSSRSRSLALAVASEFADGTSITTGSAQSTGMYPRDPAGSAVNAMWVRDARALCEFHRRRVADAGRSSTPRETPAPGRENEYMTSHWDRELARYVACGYSYRDESTGRLRATWKGAILSAWKLTDPIKRWRLRSLERTARREWVRLGMDQWQPPAETPPPPGAVATYGDPLSPPDDLRYEAAIADGQVRVDRSAAGVAMVRVGAAGRGGYVVRQSLNLLMMATLAVLAAGQLRRYWAYQSLVASMPPGAWPPARLSTNFWVMVAIATFNAALFAFGIQRAGRTTTLSATRDGVQFASAPAFPSRGFIPRDELHGLALVRAGKKSLLIAQLEGGGRRVLASARNAEEMESARMAILHATGMHADATDASVVPAATAANCDA